MGRGRGRPPKVKAKVVEPITRTPSVCVIEVEEVENNPLAPEVPENGDDGVEIDVEVKAEAIDSKNSPENDPGLSKASKKGKEVNEKKRKSRGKKSAGGSNNGNGTLFAYFKGKAPATPGTSKSPVSISDDENDSSPSTSTSEEQETKKRKIDPKMREFLDSGVPEVVKKRQKAIREKNTNEVVEIDRENSDDDFKEARTSRPRRSVRSRPIISYLQARSSSSSRSPSPQRKKKDAKKKAIDAQKREFLNSGLPDVVARAKKTREEDANEEQSTPQLRKRGRPRKSATIKSYFKDDDSTSEESESSAPSPKKEKEPKRVLDPMTRAFLDSGVPDVVVKAKKVVEQKKVEDDYLSMVQFFPKLQTLTNFEDSENGESTNSFGGFNHVVPATDAEWKIEQLSVLSKLIANSTNLLNGHRHLVCCKQVVQACIVNEEVGISEFADPSPWVDQKVEGLKELACDKEAVNKLTVWLKQWKSDIKDDGGTSRKMEIKKKRNGSPDSDFITSDEEEDDLKKKSVILVGPTGCGKTAAVYVAAKHYGFHVVEVNFSSRRPGKDVFQRVEEAVLSHRLKSSHNCLLLFEDIDLMDPKEDEGFQSAVAQLIQTAVRPIVMTTSCLGQLSLDPKLEKRYPLVIQFNVPKPSQIIRKVLFPMIRNASSSVSLNEEEEAITRDKISTLLESICRHGRNDIRQVINQTQFLFTLSQSCNLLDSTSVHKHGICQETLLDFTFIRPQTSKENCENNDQDDDDEHEMRLSPKARKAKCQKMLDSLSTCLTSLCDLDILDSISAFDKRNEFNYDDMRLKQLEQLKEDYFDENFCQAFRNTCESGVKESTIQGLFLQTEGEIEKTTKGYKLFDEIGEYCDNIESNGGWESASYVRSIIKRNVMDSVGRLAKRNGRVTSYFNRLDRAFSNRICESFDFDKELLTVKEEVVQNSFAF